MDGSNPVVTQMSLIELNGSKTKLQGLNLGKELLGVISRDERAREENNQKAFYIHVGNCQRTNLIIL